MTERRMTDLDMIRKHLKADGGDLMRNMVQQVAQQLMAAEADGLCCARHGQRHPDRINQRNGYCERAWDTRAGTINLAVPKLRQGTYFPSWLLDSRRRSEQALRAVVVASYLRGVSTRRVDGLVKNMDIDVISKSEVSRLAQSLDEMVRDFRERPLDAGPYRYVWVDALVHKYREGGRIVHVAIAVATAVNVSGNREILGVDVFTSEDGAAWLSFLRELLARGLKGVQLIISDCHRGLRDAIAATFPGAAWQRGRTHFIRNLLTRVQKASQAMVATLTRSNFMQPETTCVPDQFDRVVDQLARTRFRAAADLLVDARADLLAFADFPKQHWRQIWSNNPQERLNKEIRRHTDVVGIFPNRESVLRLVGAILAEQHDEWAVVRRYMTFEPSLPAEIMLDQNLSTGDNATVTI